MFEQMGYERTMYRQMVEDVKANGYIYVRCHSVIRKLKEMDSNIKAQWNSSERIYYVFYDGPIGNIKQWR